MPPQYVKPYVKRGKNDAADAEAMCEAMSRPTMRFVPVKTPEQQAALMLVGMRDQLIRSRTQLTNAIRGYAAEFGLIAAKGIEQDRAAAGADRGRRDAAGAGARAVRDAGQEYAQLQAGSQDDRGQADGLASRRRVQPAPGQVPRRRSDRRHDAGDEDAAIRTPSDRAATLPPGSA